MADYRIKAVSTAGGIDGHVVLKDAANDAKLWVKENRLPANASTRMERTGLLAKFSAGLCRALLARMIDLEQRIAKLEGIKVAKSLDAEVTDELAELIERVDQIEGRTRELQKDLAETGLRYRGYWRNGMTAKRNDAFTEDGSMWIALRETDDRPCNESADWAVVARKGRDAR